MTEKTNVKAVDCWVNPLTPEHAGGQQPEFLKRVARDYFHREEEIFRGTPLDDMVAMMAAEGIERGLLTINAADPEPFAKMAAAYPGRVLLSTVIDPTRGMEAVRTAERLVKEYDVRFFPELVLIMAHGADPWWGDAIRLMLKYPNRYMMTSAYLPKYLPQELIQFMNTRPGPGQGPLCH